jgi:hypothetical protein
MIINDQGILQKAEHLKHFPFSAHNNQFVENQTEAWVALPLF